MAFSTATATSRKPLLYLGNSFLLAKVVEALDAYLVLLRPKESDQSVVLSDADESVKKHPGRTLVLPV